MDDDFTPDTRKMMTYAVGGAAVVAVVIFLIALVAGLEWYYSLAAGVFVGIVVGGGLGFLAGGRAQQVQSGS